MAKAKAELICRYCGAKVYGTGNICSNCYEKKRIMHGWHWLYKGKEIKKKED